MKTKTPSSISLLFGLLALAGGVAQAAPLGTAFTYQGRLDQNGQVAPNGIYQMTFALYALPSTGTAVGSNGIVIVPVTNGLFNVDLDFGAAVFDGDARWLETSVRTNSIVVPFDLLSPRSRLAPTPNALYASMAGTADNVTSGAVVTSLNGLRDNINLVAGANVTLTPSGNNLTINSSGSGAFSLNGSSAYYNGGRVGIGTTTPLAALEIVGEWDDQHGALELRAQRPTLRLTGGAQAANRSWLLHLSGNGPGNLEFYRDNAGLWANVMALAPSGNVGIGTANPQARLHVNGPILSGQNNTLTGANSAIGGGEANLASGPHSTIGGGYGNGANDSAVVGGGFQNNADGVGGTIGGGFRNFAFGFYSTVAGGANNFAQTNYAAIGGGDGNEAGDTYDFIGGGEGNSTVDDIFPGGSGGHSTIAGGYLNRMSGYRFNSTIGGGDRNTTSHGIYATIAGGKRNAILLGESCTIGGGELNTVGNGTDFTLGATVPGGVNNLAVGSGSFAAGRGAKAYHAGSFIWSDGSDIFQSARANTFNALASGGFEFYTGTGVGARLPAGSGSWSAFSDHRAKENVRPVDGREVLKKVAALPMGSWNYKTQPASVRHLGPMAQDFHAAFGLGEDNTHIATVDADGVALAAIQGLNELVAEKDARIAALESETMALKKQLAAQQTTLARWETRFITLEQAAARAPQSVPPLSATQISAE